MKKLVLTINIIVLTVLALVIFYPNKTTNEVMAKSTDNENPLLADGNYEDLYVESNNYKKYDNNYEDEILNSDNDTYKLIKMTIDDYNVHMLVVYDPSKVRLMTSPQFNTGTNNGKETVMDMVKRNNAIAGINAGGFFDNGVESNDTPVGYIIKDGNILWDAKRPGNLIGFNNDNELTLINATGEEAIERGIRDAVEFGPFLILNGETTNDALRMYGARASRVIIAQREDGVVLMVATDGASFEGPRMGSLVEMLKLYGAVNAANLDGGASSQLVLNNKLYTTVTIQSGVLTAGRKVVTAFGVFDN